MSELRDTTKAIATQLDGKFVLEGNQLSLTEGAYESTLPEDVTAEQAKAVHKHDVNFMHGFSLAAGQAALATLSSHPELSHVEAETKVGVTNLTVNVKREGEVTIPPKQKGGDVTKETVVGQMNARLSSPNDAEMKRIRSHIGDIAKDMLANVK